MAQISVKPDTLKTQQSNLNSVVTKIRRLENELNGVTACVRTMGSSASYRSVAMNLGNIYSSLARQQGSISSMKETLEQVQRLYSTTETEIVSNGIVEDAVDWSQTTSAGTQTTIDTTNWSSTWETILEKFRETGKWDDSWLEAILGTSGSLFGVEFSGLLTSQILQFASSGTFGASWNITDGDAKIYGRAKGEFAGADISAEGNYGLLSGELSASALTGAASGEAYFALFDDGQFEPGIGISGKISGSVVNGEAKAELGTDDVSVYGKAEGDLLTGEASAGVSIGKDGVEARAAAEAYLAKGEINGGFEFFGIKVDVGLEGGFGGASVKIGGEATSDSVEAEIGAGLGIGGAAKVKVDWSGLEEHVDKIVDNIENVSDYFETVGDQVQNVSEGLTGLIQDADLISFKLPTFGW